MDLRTVARRLDYMIGQVTLDEFAWQDASYDRDSALGRELLFLIANDGWIRSTSETINIARSDAVETAIDIDIDLSRITHEAFRDRRGQIWLPIVVLPPLRPQLPEPFSTLAVTDAAGTLLMTLPRADVRHRLAAALTEIILNVVAARLSDISDLTFAARRDHRLVLSAAIYRLLRDETVPAPLLNGDRPMRPALKEPMTRIDRARDDVGNVLTAFADLLTAPGLAPQGGKAAARRLTERAILVLSALTRSAVIVIPADRHQPPTVLTVRLPGRALHFATARWADIFGPHATPHRRWTRSGGWRRRLRVTNWIFPSASLHLDLLLPSADADRQVRVNLPDGISPDPTLNLAGRAELDIRCERPFPMKQLETVTSQLLGADADWPDPLRQSLADLALAKVDAVDATLRDHRVGAGPAEVAFGPNQATTKTRAFRDRLGDLRSALHEVAAQRGTSGAAREATARAWAGGGWLASPMQRRTSTDTISPGVVAARARAIDDFWQRSEVATARMEVRIAVTDSAYFSAALLTGWINTLLMLVELLFFPFAYKLGLLGQQVSAEVLALVLTLFSAIQLGRIERPDRSAVRGVLVPSGNPLIVGAILPTVFLAVAVAFSRSLTWIMTWAGVCLAFQLFELWLMWYIQRTELHRGLRSSDIQPRHGADLHFYTDAPDYSHNTVLHSTWWRRTTAEALTIGRPAYGYLIRQHGSEQALNSLLDGLPPAGGSTLEQPRDVLALQRSGTSAQSLNFVVFRDRPDDQPGMTSGNAVQIELDPGLLTLAEDATSVISVFLGVPQDVEAKVTRHPVTLALHLAAAHGLVVHEIQLPVPAPDVRYAHLLWGRLQLNVRPEGLDRIQVFVTNLAVLTTMAVVGIRTRDDGIPRILNPLHSPAEPPGSSGPADRALPVLAADLDVVVRSRARRDDSDPTWRLTVICADWRAGVESQMLAGLDPDLVLVGLTSAILYGQSVLMLLCRGVRGQESGDDPGLCPAVVFDEWQSRDELGAAREYPLLWVRMRTPDRPGATVAVLDSLHDAIQREFPNIFSRGDWREWYARAAVRDGNMAHVQLTIVLPIDHDSGFVPAGEWGPSVFSRIERRTLTLLAQRMADGQYYPEPAVTAAETLPNTMIRLGLVKMADLNWEQAQAEQDPPVKTGAQQSSGDASVATPSAPGRSRRRRRGADRAGDDSAQPNGAASAGEDAIRAAWSMSALRNSERQMLAYEAVVAASADVLSNYRLRSGEFAATHAELEQAERLVGKCYAEFLRATGEAEFVGGLTFRGDALRILRCCGQSLFREPAAADTAQAPAFEAALMAFITDVAHPGRTPSGR